MEGEEINKKNGGHICGRRGAGEEGRTLTLSELVPKGDVTLVMYCLQQSAVRARN